MNPYQFMTKQAKKKVWCERCGARRATYTLTPCNSRVCTPCSINLLGDIASGGVKK